MKKISSDMENLIYQTAVDLMAAKGYHGTSMRDVARVVGVQMSSLYHYFDSKQDLLLLIMRRTLEDLYIAVSSPMGEAVGPKAKLSVAIRAHVIFHATRQNETLVTDFELRALEPAARDVIVKLRDSHDNLFVEVLESGREAGIFRFTEPIVVTNAFLMACAGIPAWYQRGGRLSPDEVAEHFCQIFLNGLLISKDSN